MDLTIASFDSISEVNMVSIVTNILTSESSTIIGETGVNYNILCNSTCNYTTCNIIIIIIIIIMKFKREDDYNIVISDILKFF
jgi:hypothetical protein